MRLTLRTLLAYLDDLLEPSQAKELGAKVQESEAAAAWVMRIRDVVRKRRLTAPVVSGPGCDLNANIVAEYLDNTLSPDGINALEELCHSSDVHLAEVAASHQILTLVLGEPVDIGPLSRERMYALGEVTQKHASGTVTHESAVQTPGVTVAMKPVTAPQNMPASTNGLAPAVKPIVSSRPPSSPTIPTAAALAETTTERKPDESFDHTIPDYLKAPPLWKRALPAAVALLVIVWLGMLFSDQEMLQSILGGKPGVAPQVADKGNGPAQPGEPGAVDPAKKAGEFPAADVENDDVPGPDAVNLDEMPPDQPAGEQVAAVNKPNVDAPPPEDLEDAAPAQVPTPATKSSTAPPDLEIPPATKTAPGTAVAKVDTSNAKPTPAAPTVVTARANPALYVSQDGVVLHFDADRQGWYQLPHRAHVFADDALAVPEPFDAQLQMGREKHRVTVMGPAVMGILDPMNDQPMGINLLRGRVILQPAESENPAAAKEPLKLLLSVQGVNWQLELADPSTRCGIEVIPREPRQPDENFGAAGWSGKLYLWSGSLQITNSEGMQHSMLGPDSYDLAKDPTAPDAAPAPGASLPNWDRRLSTIAQKNSRLFSDQFKTDESSARDALEGLIESRVYEQSRLAVACLGLIGDYEMMLKVLDRNEHHESRVAAINALRSWVNLEPENREKLKKALEAAFYPQEVETIYRLIWGYQDQDARSKQTSEQLVDWLEHDRLAVRELAWYHIKALTNRKQEVFDARGTPMHIKSAVQRIRKILDKDGTLLPPLPSSPTTKPTAIDADPLK